MEWLALIAAVRRRWFLIALPTLLALLFTLPSLPSSLNPSPSYQVTLRFTAAAPADFSPPGIPNSYEDSRYIPWLASEYVVVNLPPWIMSDSFAREVSAELLGEGLEINPEALRPAFIADSGRSILVIYITWAEADQIEAIAQAAQTVLQTRNQAYFPQFAAAPAQVQALDEVRVATLSPSLMSRLSPLVRIALGLVAGLGLLAAAEYLDRSLRHREELEALGYVVLAEIPRE
jgi:capsular polysaccharide biosynthesis protein